MSGLTGEPEIDHAKEIETKLQELYDTLSNRIRVIIADQKLTPDNFQIIMMKIVETIQDFSSRLPVKLTGDEKRNIATSFACRILDDLHEHGQIDEEVYAWIKLSVVFTGPILFNGLKALWRQIHHVYTDIETNGCNGCVGRNCITM